MSDWGSVPEPPSVLPLNVWLVKNLVFFSCFYASTFSTHTHFVAFLAGCKQGQICCPQYSPPSKTKCWSDRAGDWDGGNSSLLPMDIMLQPHSHCAEWLQRPPLWYPTDAGRETRSSYAHLPLGHWFPSCTLCSSQHSALACKTVLSLRLWQPFKVELCQVQWKGSLCGFGRRIINQITVVYLLQYPHWRYLLQSCSLDCLCELWTVQQYFLEWLLDNCRRIWYATLPYFSSQRKVKNFKHGNMHCRYPNSNFSDF